MYELRLGQMNERMQDIEEELELKAEVEKLKLDQALENVRREKARQRQEQRELKELHDGLSGIKNVRDEALDKLKRERQLQATKVLLIQTHRTCVRVHMFFVCFCSSACMRPLRTTESSSLLLTVLTRILLHLHVATHSAISPIWPCMACLSSAPHLHSSPHNPSSPRIPSAWAALFSCHRSACTRTSCERRFS